MGDEAFELDGFLPYLLNRAAEATSQGFSAVYREAHGLTRTQWRVLAQLGRSEAMTARAICDATGEEKSRVSRAVAALEARGWLARARSARDKRAEDLSLTEAGRAVHADLGRRARAHDAALRGALGVEAATLDAVLRRLIVGG